MWQQASVSVRQRSDFGIGDGQVGEGRAQVAHVGQAQLGGQVLAVVQRLAKQHAGVEEQHRDVARHLAARCSSTADSAPNDETRASLSPNCLVGLAQDRQRVGVAQFGVQPRAAGDGPIGDVVRSRLVVGHHSPLSSNATAASAAR
jgi:hypothetical protein